jgi:hypothetical protein
VPETPQDVPKQDEPKQDVPEQGESNEPPLPLPRPLPLPLPPPLPPPLPLPQRQPQPQPQPQPKRHDLGETPSPSNGGKVTETRDGGAVGDANNEGPSCYGRLDSRIAAALRFNDEDRNVAEKRTTKSHGESAEAVDEAVDEDDGNDEVDDATLKQDGGKTGAPQDATPSTDTAINNEPTQTRFPGERLSRQDGNDVVEVPHCATKARPTIRLTRRHAAVAHLIRGGGGAAQTETGPGSSIGPRLESSLLSKATVVEKPPTKVAERSPERAAPPENKDLGAVAAASKITPPPSTSSSVVVEEMIPAIRELSSAVRDAVSWAEAEADSSDEEAGGMGPASTPAGRQQSKSFLAATLMPREVAVFEENEKMQKTIAMLVKERDEARATCVRLCQEAARAEFRQPALTPDQLRLRAGTAAEFGGSGASSAPVRGGSSTSSEGDGDHADDEHGPGVDEKTRNPQEQHGQPGSALRQFAVDNPSMTHSFALAFQDLLGYAPTRNTDSDRELHLASSHGLQSASSLQGSAHFSESVALTTDMLGSKGSRRGRTMFHRPFLPPGLTAASSSSLSLFSSNGTRTATGTPTEEGIVLAKCRDKDCGYARRLIGLRHKHDRVVSRLRAVAQRYRQQDTQHRREIERVRREAIAGAEAGLRRLELQNAHLRRAVVKSKMSHNSRSTSNSDGPPLRGLQRSLSSSSFVGANSAVVPLPPPPPQRADRRGTRSRRGALGSVRAVASSFKFVVEARNTSDLSDKLENTAD